jgi:tRNA threonylcarbamoyladenosine biosynthesis protein TsaB
MRLLAIDASTSWGGAALLEADDGRVKLVAEIGVHVEGSHASRLLPLVEVLLASVEWPKTSIDAYAAVRGPGSFTGVRVALGLMSGFALVASRPCVGVGTLVAMAEAFGPSDAERVPLLDAGRGEVYGARFDPGSSPPVELREAWVGEPASAVESGGKLVLFGEGAHVHEARLREAGYLGPIGRAGSSVAAAAGRIALFNLAAGTVAPSDVAPLYVRPASAKARAV